MKRLLAAAVLVVVAAAAPAAEVYKAAETFDTVASIVRESHFDKAFDAAKWDRASEELRPKAVSAKTPGELRGVLAQLLGRLGLSHFAVIPGTPDNPNQHVDLSGQPGFDVRLIGRQLVVTNVEPEGGAAAAGVKPGWIVKRIATTEMSTVLAALGDATPPRVAQLEAWRMAITRLRGPSSLPLEVTFVDGSGGSITKTIERRSERGEPVTVGSLPTMFVRVESSLQSTPRGAKAGVIGFNVWMAAVDRDFQLAMDRFRDADGIVIDLRGNPGGLAAMIMGLSGHFFGEPATLGVMTTKAPMPLRFNANPRLVSAAGERVAPYAGPVAILVDGLTGSASECFSGGMQSLGRARVFGQTSMGQALPALFDKLPNGDVLIHAYGDFVTANGTRLEGRGVIPDETVPLTREDLLAGRDRTMQAALAWFDRERQTKAPQHP